MSDSSPRIIKRYANRKLYDTEESRYVTLEQISTMIREGEDVQVVDNNTKDDLTSVTLAQIIFEEEKKKRSFLPLSALRNIIRNSGESLQELMNQLSEGAERVGRMFQSEEGEEPLAEGEQPAKEPAEAEQTDPTNMFRDFRDGVHSAMEEWQNRVENSVQQALNTVSPLSSLQKDLSTLGDRIGDLEKKLTSLEDAPPADTSSTETKK